MTFALMADQEKILKEYTSGKGAVLAAPGSGKTTLISHLIAHWVNVEKRPAHHILVLTFTESAALEFESRTLKLLGPIRKPPTFSTIHGFCNRLLKQFQSAFHDREVLTDERKYSFLDTLLKKENIQHAHIDYTRFLGDVLIPRYRLFPYKTRPHSQDELQAFLGFPTEHADLILKLPQLVTAYEDRLESEGFIDYDMMITQTHKLLKENPALLGQLHKRYRYILEDEAQDSNPLQSAILELMAGETGALLRVGDPNQSIYGFNGADYKALSQFASQHQFFPMGQSNRSSQQIMDLINGFHRELHSGFPSEVMLNPGVNNPDKGWLWVKGYSELSKEVENLCLASQNILSQGQSVAVLCRTNQHCRWLHQELEKANVPALLHHDRHEHFFQSNMAIFLSQLIDFLLQPNQFHALQQVMLGLYFKREDFLTFFSIDAPVYETLKQLAEAEIYHPSLDFETYERLCEVSATLLNLVENIYTPVSFLLEKVTETLLFHPEDKAQARLLHNLWIKTHWQSSLKSLEIFQEWLDKAGKYKVRQQLSDDEAEEGLTSPGVVHLLTVHKSKGLEWDGVIMPIFQYGTPFISADKELKTILAALHEGIPYQAALDVLETYEEMEAIRLIYVGITRARKYLSMTYSQERLSEAGIYRSQPSPYFSVLRQLYQTYK